MAKGRKRKPGKREPNGRIARPSIEAVEQDAMRTAIAYRQSVFGISPGDAKDQKATSLTGRLCLAGVLSNAQWQAGEDWLRLLNAVYAAINAPRGFNTPSGASHVERSEAEEARRFQALKDAFDEANKAVEGHAPVAERIERMKALRLFLVDQVDAPRAHGTLRTALNGLANHFGHERREAA